MKNGEEIYLRAKYRLMLPFRVFVLDSVPAASVSFKRGWIGSEGGRNSQGERRQTNQKEWFLSEGQEPDIICHRIATTYLTIFRH